ncbi:MAG TPA: hypothetical protein VFF00_00835 [Candidatus Elarobacter sp.]|nr:hypothetical protein [Candidatus Elarobacter sp.]
MARLHMRPISLMRAVERQGTRATDERGSEQTVIEITRLSRKAETGKRKQEKENETKRPFFRFPLSAFRFPLSVVSSAAVPVETG